MSLTGTPFFVLTIVMVVGALAALFLLWNRVRGPRPVRALSRFGLAVFSQVAAVLMVLVYVNNNMGPFYESWSDLFGGSSAPPVTSNAGGRHVTPGDSRLHFSSYSQDVMKAHVTGPLSGIEGSIYVWLPPQYHDPAYATHQFPVVELLPGTPGTPQAWFGTMKVQDEMATLMRSGQVQPMILVSAKLNVLGGNTDPGCADIPGVARTATWLSKDVPNLVRGNFRAAGDPGHWAIMGYSAGAYCAVNLTVQHPDAFRTAVSLSGYNAPESPLVTRDPQLTRANNPLLVLKQPGAQPPISLLMAGSLQDPGTVPEGKALLAALRQPGASQLLTVRSGGHTPDVWRAMLPQALTWISGRMGA